MGLRHEPPIFSFFCLIILISLGRTLRTRGSGLQRCIFSSKHIRIPLLEEEQQFHFIGWAGWACSRQTFTVCWPVGVAVSSCAFLVCGGHPNLHKHLTYDPWASPKGSQALTSNHCLPSTTISNILYSMSGCAYMHTYFKSKSFSDRGFGGSFTPF